MSAPRRGSGSFVRVSRAGRHRHSSAPQAVASVCIEWVGRGSRLRAGGCLFHDTRDLFCPERINSGRREASKGSSSNGTRGGRGDAVAASLSASCDACLAEEAGLLGLWTRARVAQQSQAGGGGGGRQEGARFVWGGGVWIKVSQSVEKFKSTRWLLQEACRGPHGAGLQATFLSRKDFQTARCQLAATAGRQVCWSADRPAASIITFDVRRSYL